MVATTRVAAAASVSGPGGQSRARRPSSRVIAGGLKTSVARRPAIDASSHGTMISPGGRPTTVSETSLRVGVGFEGGERDHRGAQRLRRGAKQALAAEADLAHAAIDEVELSRPREEHRACC